MILKRLELYKACVARQIPGINKGISKMISASTELQRTEEESNDRGIEQFRFEFQNSKKEDETSGQDPTS
jgi:hypothetical protein